MYELPDTITIDGRSYPVTGKGDYRVVLDCIAALNDRELEPDERIYAGLIIFYGEDSIPTNLEEAVKQMMWFVGGGDDFSDAPVQKHKLVDWEQDSTMIVAGVNRVMNVEVRALPYCHWFTFLAAFMEIGESQLSTVVSIRDKIARGKKLEKWEQEFRRENAHHFRWKSDEIVAEQDKDEILSLWNSGA